MVATPKPVRKQIKKSILSHAKKSVGKTEFGAPSKQTAKKQGESHGKRLKAHAKKHGQVAMPHHKEYKKSLAKV